MTLSLLRARVGNLDTPPDELKFSLLDARFSPAVDLVDPRSGTELPLESLWPGLPADDGR